MAKAAKPNEIVESLTAKPNFLKGTMPEKEWFDTPTVFEPGSFCHAGKKKIIEYHGFPNPRDWKPFDEDWQLPENWKEILLKGFRERVEKFRLNRKPRDPYFLRAPHPGCATGTHLEETHSRRR